jgi:hypothetical protein
MSRLAHATFAAPGFEAERKTLDATVRFEARQRAIQKMAFRAMMEREHVLTDFVSSGAFVNELSLVEQPSTGRWWVQ